jgi:hypothetical protein
VAHSPFCLSHNVPTLNLPGGGLPLIQIAAGQPETVQLNLDSGEGVTVMVATHLQASNDGLVQLIAIDGKTWDFPISFIGLVGPIRFTAPVKIASIKFSSATAATAIVVRDGDIPQTNCSFNEGGD